MKRLIQVLVLFPLLLLGQENSIINRMGFNNHGAEAMGRRLEKYYPKQGRISPLGINIGKAKSTPLEETLGDYLQCIDFLN